MVDIENEIKYETYDYIRIIALKYNIIQSTLKRKYREYRLNNKENNFDIDNDNRGGNNKIFTENEEKNYIYLLKMFLFILKLFY